MSTTGRKACTTGTHCQPATLGEVVYCVVHHSRIDAKTIAERLGVRYTYLTDAASPDRDEVQFQARLIVPITLATGNDALLRYLAAQCGYVAFKVPTASDAHADVVAHTAKVVREFGDVLTASATAMADHAITASEAAGVCQEIDELIGALASHKALFQLAGSHAPALHAVAGGAR